MQMFFVLMAVFTGTLLVPSVIMLIISLEAEVRRNAPARTPEWVMVRSMPAARLTRSEYNRLIRAERSRKRR